MRKTTVKALDSGRGDSLALSGTELESYRLAKRILGGLEEASPLHAAIEEYVADAQSTVLKPITATALVEEDSRWRQRAIHSRLSFTSRSICEGLQKLLDYVYLFLGSPQESFSDKKKRLDRSIKASQAALAFDDEDDGVLQNFACAYAQFGPAEQKVSENLFGVLHKLMAIFPQAVRRLKELSTDGEDFAQWREDQQFLQILKTNADFQIATHLPFC
jgi:hypothetical protein